jgi:hypothetical protein
VRIAFSIVDIETSHGPIAEALMDRGIAKFAINPGSLDGCRNRASDESQR